MMVFLGIPFLLFQGNAYAFVKLNKEITSRNWVISWRLPLQENFCFSKLRRYRYVQDKEVCLKMQFGIQFLISSL